MDLLRKSRIIIFEEMYNFDLSRPQPQVPAYAQPPPPTYTSNLKTSKKEIVNEYREEDCTGNDFKSIRIFKITKDAMTNEVRKNEFIYIMKTPQGTSIYITDLRTGEYKEFYEFKTFNGMTLKYQVK